ncbi:MAG: DUF2309 domain-containing protein [Magnetococcales bacterium]|nr:DUF2309 domain-containing protein [Magnetococcales bacterium]
MSHDWLQQLVHRLHRLLPGQAPIRDFVHHNTLHGLQHLPFAEALATSRRINGIYGYLPLERFHQFYRQGRVSRTDLEREVREEMGLAADDDWRLRFYCTALLHDLRPIGIDQLRWRLDEEMKAADADLWQACLELLQLQQVALDPEPETLWQPSRLPAPPPEQVEPLLSQLFAGVGVDMTFRGLLLALTGQDILNEIRPLLLRHLSAWIDQGAAAWPYPQRQVGLWSASRQLLLRDIGLDWEELPNGYQEIAACPDDSAVAVEQLLRRSGIAEKNWAGYLERLALELPGWSGMVLWRHLHPGYQELSPQQVDMVDYLALRLLLERLYAARLCQRLWQLEPRIDLLRWYCRSHQAEFWLRWLLFNQSLPEHLAHLAQQLLQRAEAGAVDDSQWQRLAEQVAAWPQEQSRFGVGRSAWPLFQLARHLNLNGVQLRQMGRAAVDEMLACLNQLDDERRGWIWLQAYERHYRDQVFNALAQNRLRSPPPPPIAQLLFCMDEREEAIRRHLEEHNPAIETLGAAGFFGVPINWRGLDDQRLTALCPVVVTPAHEVNETPQPGFEQRYQQHQQRRAHWISARRWFNYGSRYGLLQPLLVTMLAAPMALLLLAAKLWAPLAVGQRLSRWQRRYQLDVPSRIVYTAPDEAAPATAEQPRLGFTDREQADRVEGLLRTIGLTRAMAPLVVIVGHGSSSQNNPHRSAYDCGACSGRHGGPNARLLAAMANRPQVRALLSQRGITIPDTTWFCGAEHDTGSESIDWFDLDQLPPPWQQPLAQLRQDLAVACALSAHERSRRLASAPRRASPEVAKRHVAARAWDFSQPRPELGHVTNAVALIGRRALARGIFFDRRMFLISYDPQQDEEGSIVEAILLAAGPVGAGINLEYYFSTVNNDRYGCGSKVTHNVTSLLGVMEGSSSDLRTGLPRQMIEIHEAMRLLVIVEQRCEVLSRIYQQQPAIRELVGNGWIHLAAIDPVSGALSLFKTATGWQPWSEPLQPLPRVARSMEWYDGHSEALPPAWVGVG